MKEQLTLLIQLQTLDLKRQKDKEMLVDFPEKLKTAEKPLLDLRAEIEQAQNSLGTLGKERREKEIGLQIIEDRILKLKLRLTELKTNKEYHAHLQEIASARKEKSETEDHLLVSMENSDLLKKELTEKEAILLEEEQAFSEIQKKLQAEMDQISSAAESTEAERCNISENISKSLLGAYKRLFQNCKGLAVVPVRGHTCTGCNFSLPPQLIAEVKMQGKVLTCNYCHRILYVQPS